MSHSQKKRQDFYNDKGFDDITKFKDNGILKRILKAGKGPRPTQFSEIELHYVGYFRNGKVWSNSYRTNEPQKFVLGKKQVIYGWELAALSMRKGEVARFKVSSAYAYGSNGLAAGGLMIEPDTNLVFDLELVDWKSMRSTKDKMMMKSHLSHQQLVDGALKEKDAGNEMFKDGDYWDAIERYDEALEYGRFVYEPKLRHTTRPVMLSCHLNKAQCYLKLKDFKKALASVEEAMKLDTHNAKAFYRRAIAYRQLGKLGEAKRDILQAQRLEPKDPAITHELQVIDWTTKQLAKREKLIYQHLFEDPDQVVANQKQKQEQPRKAAVKKTAEPSSGLKYAPQFKQDPDHVTLPGEENIVNTPNWEFLKEQKKSDVPATKVTNPNWKFLQQDSPPPALEESYVEEVPEEATTVEEEKAQKERGAGEAASFSAPKPDWAFLKSAEADSDYVYDNKVLDETNPKVFLNVSISGEPAGKLILELFAHLVPRTCDHFLSLAEHNLAGSSFHRVVKDYMVMGGKDVHGDVTPIVEERMDIPLDREGLVVMATKGKNTVTVGSQFFITTVATPHLTGKYVVVGKVIEGVELLLDTVQLLQVDTKGRPKKSVTIRSAGEFDLF